MIAADRSRWREFVEAVVPWMTRGSLGVAVLVAILALTFHAGHVRGADEQRAHVADSIRVVQKDTIRVVEARIVHDTVVVHATAAKADTARTAFRAAEALVTAVADTSATVPSSLVLPALHACDQVIHADSIAYRAQAALLVDVTEDRDTWKARALNDEASTPKPSRFGFKSGAATGAAIVALIVHFLK